MTVLKYYTNQKFNPVPITFYNKKNIKVHYQKRENLLENHLKIPLFLLEGKNVLEFGCNGGENACVLASYGSNIYLVEPNDQMHSLIIKNFKLYTIKLATATGSLLAIILGMISPKISNTVTKTAAINLFISNESILIFFKMHI